MDYLMDIPYGQENAVSRRELARLWGITDRSVRKVIQRLRVQCGAPILGDRNGGYYRTLNPIDVRAHLRVETTRAVSILHPLRGMYDLSHVPDRQSRLRVFREQRGMSQGQFVKRMAKALPQMDRVALSKAECGHVLLPPEAVRVAAQILEVKPCDIYPTVLMDYAGLWEDT